MRVAIAGAGIVGLTTAWALSSRGHDVTLFDRGPIPNPIASSYDQQRYHRFAYGTMGGYSKLSLGAPAAWNQLWATLHQSFYVETGVLYVGPTDHDDIVLSAQFARDNGLRFDEIDASDFTRRYPHLSLRPSDRAVFYPQSGILLAERILYALARWLQERGVSLRPYSKVQEVDHENGRVRALGSWQQFDQVIVSAGPWTGELVPDGEQLQPSRHIMLYARPPERFAEAWANSPAFSDLAVKDNFYVTPPLLGTEMKMTFDMPFERANPNTTREASDEEIATVTAIARDALAFFDDYEILGGRACYYTNTADRSFFVRSSGRSLAVSTCSGHGFKFGAFTGIKIADAVDGLLSGTELRQILEAKSSKQ